MSRIDNRALAVEDASLSIGAIEKANSVIMLCSGLPIRTLVDIGSGTGAVLERLDEAGFADAYDALEPAASMLDYMVQHRSISRLRNAEAATLESSETCQRHYDLAIISHVLEHLENPAALLLGALHIADFVIAEVPLDGNFTGNVRAALKTRITGNPRENNRSGHIQFFDPDGFDSLIQWCGGEVLARRSYTPTPQLRHMLDAGSRARRLYARIALSASRIVGDERWARFYHGHYAVLIRKRQARANAERSHLNAVYFGHPKATAE